MEISNPREKYIFIIFELNYVCVYKKLQALHVLLKLNKLTEKIPTRVYRVHIQGNLQDIRTGKSKMPIKKNDLDSET